MWAQVAPGNAASLRAFLRRGFVPIGAEVLIHPVPRTRILRETPGRRPARLSVNRTVTRLTLTARHVRTLDKAPVVQRQQSRSREHMRPDIVIRGGTVVDGTGAPAFESPMLRSSGDVISEIAALADGGVQQTGRREIDAEGRLVTPGFVDIHTHLDAQTRVGSDRHVELLARRDQRGDGQLWGHVRAVPARRTGPRWRR